MRSLLLRVAAATVPAAGLAAPASAAPGAWGWPVEPPPVVSAPFAAPAHAYGPGHRGVDLDAPPGTVVRAPGDGTVVLAEAVAGVPVVVVAHGARRTATELRSTLQPVRARVPAGTVVRRGDPVGEVAAWPEHCTGCLHWGVRRGHDYLDPLRLLRGAVRLLPVGPPVRQDAPGADGSPSLGPGPAAAPPPTPGPFPTAQSTAATDRAAGAGAALAAGTALTAAAVVVARRFRPAAAHRGRG